MGTWGKDPPFGRGGKNRPRTLPSPTSPNVWNCSDGTAVVLVGSQHPLSQSVHVHPVADVPILHPFTTTSHPATFVDRRYPPVPLRLTG